MKLTYQAVNREGKTIKGTLDAKDTADAVSYLRSRGFLPIKVLKETSNDLLQNLSFLNKLGSSDLLFFTRQLSSMLTSGLTLMQALNILKEQTQNPAMVEVISDIIYRIEEGKSLSESIAKYPHVFSSLYVSLIKAAEVSGLLDKVLLRLADNLEKQQKLKSTIKSALMYPAIVVTGMVIVMVIMMVFVVPQLTVLYENLNIELPLPTQIVIAMSNFITIFWPLIIVGSILFFIFYKRWRKTEPGQLIMDDLFLKTPVFGKLIKQMILTEFTRTLGLLVGSGTLIVEALKQTSGSADNIFYKNAINGVSLRVEKGISVGDAMSAYVLFPPILTQMVKIGEETGKLDESLTRVSEYFEREVDQTVKTLTTALEPIIMVVLGLGVAFLIISIITPIYNLTSAIQ